MKYLAILITLALTSFAQENPGLFQAGGGIFYQTQDAIDGTITLDASNGFFDKGAFRASGGRPAGDRDKAFIREQFSELRYTGGEKGDAARWHVYFSKAGRVSIEVDVEGVKSGDWVIAVGEQSQRLASRAGSALSFRVAKPGHQVVRLVRRSDGGDKKLAFERMKLTGTAAAEAKIIRARWRPSAVHTRFSASTVEGTQLWVFESQSVGEGSSYSPMTTAFGYFGATFDAEGKAAGGINFSMWAASQKAKEAPALADSPRLIATGNPQAEFSGFGHEGSGVKIRGWEPFSHGPKSVIQALRLETGENYNTYYGYLFDERSGKWVLYAAGQEPVNPRRPVTKLRATSFCEVPGPASVERTGDVQRTMRRRGWFRDERKRWHPVDQIRMSGRAHEEPTSHQVGAQLGGWLTMTTGGVELREPVTSATAEVSRTLPSYLKPGVAEQLDRLPNAVSACDAIDITPTSATVRCAVEVASPELQATLYYGRKDAFTSVKRKLHGTEKKGVSGEMLADDRVWQNNAKIDRRVEKAMSFRLDDLTPGTEYFCRLFFSDANGKYWASDSTSFETEL